MMLNVDVAADASETIQSLTDAVERYLGRIADFNNDFESLFLANSPAYTESLGLGALAFEEAWARIVAGQDFLEALRLLFTAPTLTAFAPIALCRSTVACSAWACWLMGEPGLAPEARLHRGVLARYKGLLELARVGGDDEHHAKAAQLCEDAAERQIPLLLNKRDKIIGFGVETWPKESELVADMMDLEEAYPLGSGLTYALLSGATHGQAWFVFQFVEFARGEDPLVLKAHIKPSTNIEFIVRATAEAVHSHARAFGLYGRLAGWGSFTEMTTFQSEVSDVIRGLYIAPGVAQYKR